MELKWSPLGKSYLRTQEVDRSINSVQVYSWIQYYSVDLVQSIHAFTRLPTRPDENEQHFLGLVLWEGLWNHSAINEIQILGEGSSLSIINDIKVLSKFCTQALVCPQIHGYQPVTVHFLGKSVRDKDQMLVNPACGCPLNWAIYLGFIKSCKFMKIEGSFI